MQTKLTKEDWLTIAKSYESLGPTKLAAQLGVSTQLVFYAADILRKNGVNIPTLRRSSKETIGFVKSKLKAQ